MKNKRGFWGGVLFLCALSMIGFSLPRSQTIETDSYVVYIPSGLAPNALYPLMIALSPFADAKGMIDLWRRVSERHKWLLLASKKFRNGVDCYPFFDELYEEITSKGLDLPIDRRRIAATGYSGGGMGSHMFAFKHPDLIAAVVVNTGMIGEYYYQRKDRYPKGKLAVFLASPTDFRYEEMRRDRRFLEGLGWQTQWIEFEGGHQLAPATAYDQAAEWLISRWKKEGSGNEK